MSSILASFLMLALSHTPELVYRTPVRVVKQDSKGNIWFASPEGVFRYDGKSFTNVASNVSSVRFLGILEDRKGQFWFGSVGSGVYYYDGKSLKHFTTKDGLADDRVTDIYEDRAGHIWFGTLRGASRYDGTSFRTYKMKDEPPDVTSIGARADKPWVGLSDSNDVNAIIQDRTGKFWFGTRGEASVYDGKAFSTLTHYGGAFTNVRSIIEDKKGNIWLGGNDGLWRYDGTTFTNFGRAFVGQIYEDREGNIWTSSDKAQAPRGPSDRNWVLSRYDATSLSNPWASPTEIDPKLPILFGILEDDDGDIWFAGGGAVYRYDASTVAELVGQKRQK